MTLGRLILRGLAYHWRTNLAVALAIVATSAVLTGALLVGDSMRGSLRHLLLEQLGQIDDVLVADRFFRTELADEVERGADFKKYFTAAVPAVFVQGTVENPQSTGALRAGRVTVVGCDDRFWKLGSHGPAQTPLKGEIVLNAPLAGEIGAREGDEVLLRIGSVSQIPPDSALGRKLETVRSRRLRVSAIIPAEGLGRFGLHPSQQNPRDAFVATETLQDALEQPDKVNAIFVAGRPSIGATQPATDTLARDFHPKLDDYGLEFQRHSLGYIQCTSNRMLLEPAAVEAIERTFADEHPQEVFTYLANSIAAEGREIPYSTITAIDFAEKAPLGPLETPEGQVIGPLADDEIVLNAWAADDLGVKPGAEIEIAYFEPESTHGRVRESTARFRLKAIAAIRGAADDKNLTPQMPGVTDRLTIGDWDAPFPFDAARVRKKDEQYWDDYRTTPKAFISLAAGRRLWSSRFGNTTSVRFAPPEGVTPDTMAARLALDPDKFGLQFIPIKQMGLAAAGGTTPFDGLFLGFSLFIMVSSLLLVALLFRLGLEQRAVEIGILRAVGLGGRRIFAVLAVESFLLTLLASLAGAAAGVGYAWLMITGLTTLWRGATGSPFLQLYITPQSIGIGIASAVLVCLATILWTLWRMRHLAIRQLLAGEANEPGYLVRTSSRWSKIAWVGLLILSLVVAGSATALSDEAQAGAFVGSGALVLAAGLTFLWGRLRRGAGGTFVGARSAPIARLAMRNGARHPSRSTLSIGLIAAASFLIVALSAFRLDPASQGHGLDSGSGGFDLVAQSDQPIYQDLNSAAGRADLGFSTEAETEVKPCLVVPLRVHDGDDASCLNLYRPTQPRVLGVSTALVERGGFAWASTAAETAHEQRNPWLLLDRQFPVDADGVPVVPVVIDYNTAMYSLHLEAVGRTLDIKDESGSTVRCRIVGLLKNSIFQGDLLLGERAFLARFPRVSGYRFFLIDTHGEALPPVRHALDSALGDYGFDAESTADRLAGFFAVQNTYLSTFQSLGGLGLLLGTFALAAVQLRSVLERRGELALMRAAGFRRAVLARLVMIENSLLLVGGLAVGVVAALVAVLPYWLGGGASIPWLSLAGTLAVVLLVGMLAGLVAVRAVLTGELLPALREE